MPDRPIVPEFITVHLGKPNAAARNVRVPFAQYIKNVASSEIYPTWPENAPLTGLLYCADCGGKMYVHRTNNGKRISQYT